MDKYEFFGSLEQFFTKNLWYFELLLRMILACGLGMMIGFERKHKNKMAGIRTHAIVAFGAALMMLVSKYGLKTQNLKNH